MKRMPGRPRIDPPADAATRIETLAAKGAAIIGIASALHVSRETLNRWMDEDEGLRAALDRGRERERVSLHNALYRAAMKGNVVASIFLLKARHGYREGDVEQANRVSITFALPGAMSMEEFRKGEVIDGSDSYQSLPAPHPPTA